jgi:hypothetical protein
VPGQAAVTVVVLAMNVARDRAGERHVAGTRHDRQGEPVGSERSHQLGDRHAGLRGYQPALAVDRDDLVQACHVEHVTAAVLGGVAIAAPGAPGDHAGLRPHV